MSGFTYKSPSSVGINSPLSSFDEINVSELTPAAGGDFVYNINGKIFESITYAGGSVEQADGMGVVNSSTSQSGSAALQLRRALKYQPGQGSLFRGTALFTTGTTGNIQIIGVGNGECGYFFGYLNTNFGILHQPTSKREIRMLTVTTPANTENVTVVLDGQSVVVPVVGGLDTSRTSYQIARADYTQVGNGWIADAIDSTVYFLSARAGPYTGAFSATGASAGSLGTFTRTRAGVAPASTFITQSAWNIDPLDGTGPSRMTLDPTKGNVYQVGFQYLGFGNAFFSIENPETGRLTPVHMIKNANSRTTPVLLNPNILGFIASSNIPGAPRVNVPAKSASMASFTEGKKSRLDPKFSYSNRYAFPNTSGNWRGFLAMKVNQVFNGQACFGEWDLLRMAVSNETGGATPKSFVVGIFLDTTVTGDLDFQYVNQTQSIMSYATVPDAAINTTTFTPTASPIITLPIGPASVSEIDLAAIDLVYGPGRIVLFAVRSNDAITGEFSINWFEQQ